MSWFLGWMLEMVVVVVLYDERRELCAGIYTRSSYALHFRVLVGGSWILVLVAGIEQLTDNLRQPLKSLTLTSD
jgi:hypothetical protein